ncbi:VOC family protein [Streptomyces sodiiphilus]|uniref:VOC family protein n=1 Tax=Streptomyces sodiiphilus TaxID=226217 RepID=A0ABN2PUW8_9ACTN
MNWTLEVVVVPVTDVERAKRFYADQVGFHLDFDEEVVEGIRVVQLTPRGSACSIIVGTGVGAGEPGSLQGVQLVVSDIEAARAELLERGVEVSEIKRLSEQDGGTFVYFRAPDGNGWAVQEIRARAA